MSIKRREELLAPMYHTVAVHFADLHDTPVRMKEKAVIQEIIPWRDARARLHWRLKRRLLEASLKAEIDGCLIAGPGGDRIDHGQKTEMLRRWFIEDHVQARYEIAPDSHGQLNSGLRDRGNWLVSTMVSVLNSSYRFRTLVLILTQPLVKYGSRLDSISILGWLNTMAGTKQGLKET